MADALDDAWAKVDRAGEHIEALKAEVRRFSNGRPYSVTGDPDLNTGEYVLRIKPEEPPKRVSVLIGDVLGNLRPSLDYLVGALAVLDGGKVQQSHQFPICDTPVLFKSELDKGRLAGIAPDHVALIEKLQPYKRRRSKIWVRLLREYSNPDKHRHLNVLLTHIEGDFALPSPEQPRVTVSGNPEAAMEALRKALESGRTLNTTLPAGVLTDVQKAREALLRGRGGVLGSLAASASVARGTVVPSITPSRAARSALAAAAVSPVPQAPQPPAKRNVHVELSVAVGVAFPDGAPVVETMEILESQVAKTLDAFEPLFD